MNVCMSSSCVDGGLGLQFSTYLAGVPVERSVLVIFLSILSCVRAFIAAEY